MKYTKLRRALSALLCCVLLVTTLILPQPKAEAASVGTIRVRIATASDVSRVVLVSHGNYSVGGDGSRPFKSGSTATITLSGGSLKVTIGGNSYSMGTRFKMIRHLPDTTENAVSFSTPSLSKYFPGDIEFIVSGGSILTVCHLDIEDYVRGVLECEWSSEWPYESQKSMAIVARTKGRSTMERPKSAYYDIRNTSIDQAFRGITLSNTTSGRAASDTAGIVVRYQGKFIDATYGASNGGQIEAPDNWWGGSPWPYVKVKDDPYDYRNPKAKVNRLTVYADFANNLSKSKMSSLNSLLVSAVANKLGVSSSSVSIVSISDIYPHTAKYPSPSRVYTKMRFELTAKVSGSNRSVSVDLDIYSQLDTSTFGLNIQTGNNELYTVARSGSNFVIESRRWGHGVGYSQYGAGQMASEGFGWRDILDFYYNDVCDYPVEKLARKQLTQLEGSTPGDIPEYVPFPGTLRKGSSGDAVRQAQERLNELGYDCGTPDGYYGTNTVNAVKAFQAACGLEADGVLGSATHARLYADDAPYATATATPAATPTGAPTATPAATPTTAPTTTPGATPTAVPFPGTLRRGSTGDAVRRAQQRLNELGYNCGTPDGTYGTNTVNAVKAFQAKCGLTADGVLGSSTHAKLFAANAPYASPTATPTAAPTPTPTATPTAKPTATPTAAPTATPTAVPFPGTLRKGSTGDAVRRAQLRLNELGYGCGTPDGTYGTNTVNAVKAFQAKCGLTADGVLGSSTHARLYAADAPYASPTTAPTATPTATPTTKPTEKPTSSPTSAPNRTGVVIADELNVRSSPSTSSTKLGTLSRNTVVTILETTNGWYRISFGSGSGYVSSQYIRLNAIPTSAPTSTPTSAPTSTPTAKPTATPTATPAPTENTGTDPHQDYVEGQTTAGKVLANTLYMRLSASANADIIYTLKKDNEVKIIGITADYAWYYVSYGSHEGYCASQYIKPFVPTQRQTADDESEASEPDADAGSQSASQQAAQTANAAPEPTITPGPTVTPEPTATPKPVEASGTAEQPADSPGAPADAGDG